MLLDLACIMYPRPSLRAQYTFTTLPHSWMLFNITLQDEPTGLIGVLAKARLMTDD